MSKKSFHLLLEIFSMQWHQNYFYQALLFLSRLFGLIGGLKSLSLVVAFILSQIPLACCNWFITSVIPSLKLSFIKSSYWKQKQKSTVFYTCSHTLRAWKLMKPVFTPGKICYTGYFISIDVWPPHRCVLNLNVEYNSNKLFLYNIPMWQFQYVTKFKNKISINQFCFWFCFFLSFVDGALKYAE